VLRRANEENEPAKEICINNGGDNQRIRYDIVIGVEPRNLKRFPSSGVPRPFACSSYLSFFLFGLFIHLATGRKAF